MRVPPVLLLEPFGWSSADHHWAKRNKSCSWDSPCVRAFQPWEGNNEVEPQPEAVLD